MGELRLFGLGGTLQQGIQGKTIAPKYSLDEVITSVFKGKSHGSIRAESITNKDSNNLTLWDETNLLLKIHDALLNTAVDGVLVTMGTDRLADIASLVEFSIRPLSKPVIFTGSMYTLEEQQNDVSLNLTRAVTLLKTMIAERSLSKGTTYGGVAIVMGDYALYAHSSFKLTTTDRNAFVCAWNKPLAEFHGKTMRLHRKQKPKKRHLAIPQLHLPKLGTVRIEKLSLGYQADLDHLLSSEAIIYAGTGDGNFPKELLEGMHLLADQRYIPQILCSEVPLRVACSQYEAGVVPHGVIPSVLPITSTYAKLAVILHSASHLQGRTKQMYVLGCFQEEFAQEFTHLQEH
ncbi:asparaginase [Candidatus Woesearchaeota archaeon]|nr:asparaginase [Candidatus Woesearchaeota archaeon]